MAFASRRTLCLAIILLATGLAHAATAAPPEEMTHWVPREAVAVVGLSLGNRTHPALVRAGERFLRTTPAYKHWQQWLSAAALEDDLTLEWAMVVEQPSGKVAVVLALQRLSDPQFSKLAAILETEPMERSQLNGGPLWTGSEATTAIARLAPTVVTIGDVGPVRAVAGAIRRPIRAKDTLGGPLDEVTPLASAFFVHLETPAVKTNNGPAGEPPVCTGPTLGQVVEGDGLLLKIKRTCGTPQSAKVEADRLEQQLESSTMSAELVNTPALASLLAEARIRTVGSDVHMVVAASSSQASAALDGLAKLLGPHAD